MDQKTWLWKKRSSEKTVIANGKGGFDLKGKVEEVVLPTEKELALEESVKALNEELDSLTNECNAKEELLKEAALDQDKAVQDLKAQLDEAMQQKTTVNDRVGILNGALKDSMQQLSSIRDEKERILSETNKKISSLSAESSHLQRSLQMKEKLIAELTDQRTEAEAEFSALMARSDSIEKENAFLKYELMVLEKDLDLRNQEIEFARRAADESERNFLQSMNKVKKLEAECQKLRILARKRVPAPLHMAHIKAEVEMQEKFQMDSRRKKMVQVTGRDSLDVSSKRISFLVERLQEVEQENRHLRMDLVKKREDETPEQKMLGISDMSLMDDFVEMEKLAIVAVEKDSSESREWLPEMVKKFSEKVSDSGKSIDELLLEIKNAFQTVSGSELPPISGYLTWKNDDHSGSEQLRESELEVQVELEAMRESKRAVEEQLESQKMMNEELETQLNMEKARLNEVSQKLASLEVEMEDKIQHCGELEGTCLEYKLQLESMEREDIAKDDTSQEQNLFQTGWDMKAASLKLAEYEETLLNLGNDLKASKKPNEATSYVSKALSRSTKNSSKLKHHFTLLDRILTEDHQKGSPGTESAANPGALVVFPGKKRAKGVGIVGKLLIWRKRSGSKKPPLSFST